MDEAVNCLRCNKPLKTFDEFCGGCEYLVSTRFNRLIERAKLAKLEGKSDQYSGWMMMASFALQIYSSDDIFIRAMEEADLDRNWIHGLCSRN